MSLSIPRSSGSAQDDDELSRLISAAVVSSLFCHLLLTDAALALAAGYHGDLFYFSPEVHELILSIRATSLADFAQQLSERLFAVRFPPLVPAAAPHERPAKVPLAG